MNRRALLFLFVAAVAVLAMVGTWIGNRMAEIGEGAAALEPRAFETFTLVFAGTGGSHANPLRRGPALAVGVGTEVLLVDAGRGVAESLRASAIPTTQPRAVYLTSLLPENTVGLDDLALAGWIAGRRAPLPVLGPPGTRALVEGLEAAHRAGREGQGAAFGLPHAGARLRPVELADGAVVEEGPLRVRAASLPGGPVPALAYRVEHGDRAVVVGGVAWGEEALVELARGADVLVHEAFFAESVEMAIAAGALEPERLRQEATWRTPLPTAGLRARRAGVPNLALVRLRPPPLFRFQAARAAAGSYGGEVLVPEDGEELELAPRSQR